MTEKKSIFIFFLIISLLHWPGVFSESTTDVEESTDINDVLDPRQERGNPNQHFLRSLRAPKSALEDLQRMLRSDGSESTFGKHYLRTLRSVNDEFPRPAREQPGSLHFLRSLKSNQEGSHFLRSLRSAPGSSQHFLRSLKSGQESGHFLRSLRGNGSSHFLRSLKSGSEVHFLRPLRAEHSLHFLRSLRAAPGTHFLRSLRSGSHFLRSLRGDDDTDNVDNNPDYYYESD